jgi:hypothetical protein
MPLNIKRRRETIAFYPDLAIAQDVEAAETALDEAKAKVEDATGTTLASRALTDAKKAVTAAQAAYDEVKARADATVLDITLEALPRKRWAEAEENNPPRDGDKTDATFSVNIDTFLAEVLPESVAEVKERATGERLAITADEWRDVLDDISDGQYQVLLFATLNLNRGASSHPF